jgi:hypothetical protein
VKYLSIILFFFAFSGFQHRHDQNLDDFDVEYRTVDNHAFQAGEKTKYLVHYGLIDAGIAELEVRNSEKQMRGRDMLHIIGKGESRGLVDFFFHVEDKYESFVDKDGIFPWLFIRDVNEGGYEIHQTYKFFQNKRQVLTQKGKTHDVPPAVQDMLSAAFYARTMDLDNLKKGEIVTVKSFVDDENFDLKIRFKGVDDVNVKSGKYRCLVFNPVIQEGRVFKTEDDMEVWISDDGNKLPILCKAKILVGSIKVELIDWEGLANPMARKSD